MPIGDQTRTVTTDSGGAAEDYLPAFRGRMIAITYLKNASTPYDNGVDFALTNETTGESIWTGTNVNASTTIYPRVATHTTAGAAVTYDGTRPVLEPPAFGRHRCKIVISSGGDTKVGSFIFVVET